ncbi:MAG TPA: ribosome maturation factor RimM [Micromonosporaceae bacterium]|nr:ribosome maturation factor RimM [Micromonosporaceae bacterium]
MLLVIGQIIRPHGIRGEVIVEVRTDEPEQRYVAGSELRTDTGSLRIEQARPHAAAGRDRLIVAFDGVYDRTTAENLRGILLWVDSAEVPASEDPDEFPDHELIGLAAVTPEGERLGEVTRIDHAPASDLLVLRLADGRTALVPFVAPFVPEVDVAGGRIVLTPPPGLLEL